MNDDAELEPIDPATWITPARIEQATAERRLLDVILARHGKAWISDQQLEPGALTSSTPSIPTVKEASEEAAAAAEDRASARSRREELKKISAELIDLEQRLVNVRSMSSCQDREAHVLPGR